MDDAACSNTLPILSSAQRFGSQGFAGIEIYGAQNIQSHNQGAMPEIQSDAGSSDATGMYNRKHGKRCGGVRVRVRVRSAMCDVRWSRMQ
jgi:hypothetical protein